MTPSDLAAARLAVERLAADDLALAIQVRDVKRRRDRLTRRLAVLRFCQSSREGLDHSLGRVGGFFIAIVLVPAMFVFVASLLSPSAVGYLAVVAFALTLAGALYMPLSFLPDDKQLDTIAGGLAAKVDEARIAHAHLAAQESRLGDELKLARRELERLQTLIAPPRRHDENEATRKPAP